MELDQKLDDGGGEAVVDPGARFNCQGPLTEHPVHHSTDRLEVGAQVKPPAKGVEILQQSGASNRILGGPDGYKNH